MNIDHHREAFSGDHTTNYKSTGGSSVDDNLTFVTPIGSEYGSDMDTNGYHSPISSISSDTEAHQPDLSSLYTDCNGHISNDNVHDIKADNQSSGSVTDGSETKSQLYKAYPSRWYVLILFSLLAFSQGCVWNTWGPIAASTELAYGWGDWTISLLAAWGPVMFMLTVLGFSWLAETRGLRPCCLIASACVAIGTGVRCITQTPPYVTWCMNIGQIFDSIAGPVAMAISCVISATWFPAGQRTTATAISNRLMGLGGGIPFIAGPLLVHDVPHNTSANSTALKDLIRHDISIYMYIEAGFAGAVFLAMLIYFPSKPPTPPSLAIAKRQVSFGDGMKQIIRHKNFWLLGFPYATTYGTYIGWIATLDVNLKSIKHPLSQMAVGWLGFIGTVISFVLGIFVGSIVDALSGKTKPFLVFLFSTGTAAYLWFALICSEIIPYNTASLYISRTVGGVAMSVMVPLVFETLCETTYPIPESVTNGMLTLLKNFWCLVFLAILWIPGVGTKWMNWLLIGTAGCCIPLVLLFKETHGRLDIDNQPTETQSHIQNERETTEEPPNDETTPLLRGRR